MQQCIQLNTHITGPALFNGMLTPWAIFTPCFVRRALVVQTVTLCASCVAVTPASGSAGLTHYLWRPGVWSDSNKLASACVSRGCTDISCEPATGCAVFVILLNSSALAASTGVDCHSHCVSTRPASYLQCQTHVATQSSHIATHSSHAI